MPNRHHMGEIEHPADSKGMRKMAKQMMGKTGKMPMAPIMVKPDGMVESKKRKKR